MNAVWSVVLVAGISAADYGSLPIAATQISLRQQVQGQPGKQEWHTDFNQARAESNELRLPMVLHFHAEWCNACQRMERSVLGQPKLLERLGTRVVGVKIDADRYPKLISMFNIQALPADVFVGADGRMISDSLGFRGIQSYIAALDDLAATGNASGNWDGVKLGPDAWSQFADSESSESHDTKCVLQREDGEVIGMGGYSPVALKHDRAWTRGKAEFRHRFQGINYHLASEEELEAFRTEPEKYAPKLAGCDPVVLSNHSKVLPGRIELGVFYKDHVYFFASDISRDMFKRNPGQYREATDMVDLDIRDIKSSM